MAVALLGGQDIEALRAIHGLQYDADMTAKTSLVELLGGFKESGGALATDLAPVAVPREVTVDPVGGRLVWSVETHDEREALKRRLRKGLGRERDLQLNLKTVGSEALREFVQLASAPPLEIAEFARRWGALSICRKHYLPSSHDPLCGPARSRDRGQCWEPLIVWKHFAAQAALILQAVEAIRARDEAQCDKLSTAISNSSYDRPLPKPRRVYSHKPNEHGRLLLDEFGAMFEAVLRAPDEFTSLLRTEEETDAFIDECSRCFGVSRRSADRKFRQFLKHLPHWLEVLREVLSWSEETKRERYIQGAANVVAGRINEWLEYGAVKPSMTWKAGKIVITLRSGAWEAEGLFGALAVQLLMTVSSVEGLALCSGCGAPYQPTRKPAAGKRHYCNACGLRVAQRDASRAYRERRRRIAQA